MIPLWIVLYLPCFSKSWIGYNGIAIIVMVVAITRQGGCALRK